MINIYKLTSKKYPYLIYIGKTEQALPIRLSHHKSDAKKKNNEGWCSSCRLANKQDVVITLLRVCNKNEGAANEQLYMILAKLLFKNGYINDRWAIRLSQAYYDRKYYKANREKHFVRARKYRKANSEKILLQRHEYRKANKEKIAQKKKEYGKANSDKISLRMKEYYKANQNEMLLKKKEYRKVNRDRIALRNKERVTCECGCESSRVHISRHLKTKKHHENLANLKKETKA